MGQLLAATHPWAEGFSDGVAADLSATAVSVLLGAVILEVSSFFWLTGGAS